MQFVGFLMTQITSVEKMRFRANVIDAQIEEYKNSEGALLNVCPHAKEIFVAK